MNIVAPLIRLIEPLNAPGSEDAQYLNNSKTILDVPHGIRVFVRNRRASLLGRAVHNQHTLIIPLKNPGQAIVNRQCIRLEPGHALLVFPQQVHDYLDVVEENILWLFCGFVLEDNAPYRSLRNIAVRLCAQSALDLEAIIRLALLHEASGLQDSENRGMRVALRLKLLLEQLLDNRERDLRTGNAEHPDWKPDAEASPMIIHACNYINAHLGESISITRIAETLHISPGHLSNEFNRQLGFSLGRYTRYMKMLHACTLITTTDLPLSEIGERCGYGSIYAFSRAFKTEKGISPSQYRNQHQEPKQS